MRLLGKVFGGKPGNVENEPESLVLQDFHHRSDKSRPKCQTPRRVVSLVDPNEPRPTRNERVDEPAELEPAKSENSVPNIWDIHPAATNDFNEEEVMPAPLPQDDANVETLAERPNPGNSRRRRTKTRLIGFSADGGEAVDMFSGDAKNARPHSTRFPVGWLAVVKGPGRGEVFALHSGMSQIGRGEDQAVQLDFGDDAISRTNHAAVVYDSESRNFFIGHGGKSNIVRLNDAPLISNETLAHGDKIRIGETILMFVALCDQEFHWEETDLEENENVEIS